MAHKFPVFAKSKSSVTYSHELTTRPTQLRVKSVQTFIPYLACRTSPDILLLFLITDFRPLLPTTPSSKTTRSWRSATAYSVYSHLSSIQTLRLLPPQSILRHTMRHIRHTVLKGEKNEITKAEFRRRVAEKRKIMLHVHILNLWTDLCFSI
jgi:hypothetical protein